MSNTRIYIVTTADRIEFYDNIPNGSAFHMVIWRELHHSWGIPFKVIGDMSKEFWRSYKDTTLPFYERTALVCSADAPYFDIGFIDEISEGLKTYWESISHNDYADSILQVSISLTKLKSEHPNVKGFIIASSHVSEYFTSREHIVELELEEDDEYRHMVYAKNYLTVEDLKSYDKWQDCNDLFKYKKPRENIDELWNKLKTDDVSDKFMK